MKHASTECDERCEKKSTATELVDACAIGDLQRVKQLLEAGADPMVPGNFGGLPLVVAVCNDRTEVMSALLDHDVDIDGMDGTGATALVAACKANAAPETIALLISEDAYLDLADQYGMTPLLAAIKNRRSNIVKMLLEAGADPNLLGGEEEVPVVKAIESQHPGIVRALLERGADLDVAEYCSQTLLEMAIARKNDEIVDALIAAGADVDERLKDDRDTALILACRIGYVHGVEKLLDADADVTARNNAGHSAADVARDKPEIMAILDGASHSS